MTLLNIRKFVHLLFNDVSKSVWTKLDAFLEAEQQDFVETELLSEYDCLLLEEHEFMLLLPIIQFVYDQCLVLFRIICDRKLNQLMNSKAILLLMKRLLFFTSLWLQQSSIRPKHQPVFDKYVQNIDMRKFFILVSQSLTNLSLDVASEGDRQQMEKLTESRKNVAAFLRYFRPIGSDVKPFVSGIFSMRTNNRSWKFLAVNVDDPVRDFPNAPESVVDDVRFAKLGVRPVTSYKVCSRCGRKQGQRAKKQFKWPLWEAMWEQGCICGGSWRRQVMWDGVTSRHSTSQTASQGGNVKAVITPHDSK